MSTTIQLRRGPSASLPVLADGEPGWTTDTHRIYVGMSGTNYQVGGGVTSVALAAPGQFSVSGSPVTASGTLILAWQTQAPNVVFAGPAAGAAATPTFRALVTPDLPGPSRLLAARLWR